MVSENGASEIRLRLLCFVDRTGFVFRSAELKISGVSSTPAAHGSNPDAECADTLLTVKN